jgi:RimJ/RimL family protein N-acetyltransferase
MIESLPEVLTGPDVTLRRYRLTDAEILKESIATSQEHLRRYMPWAIEPPTDESVMDFLKPSVESFRTDNNANYAITRTDDGLYVGGCGLHDRVGPGVLEIGYWVDVRHVRRGVATAAARLLTEAAFGLGVEQVIIRCDVSNQASAGVPRRLGYTLREVRAKESLAPGETGQEMVWVKLRTDD